MLFSVLHGVTLLGLIVTTVLEALFSSGPMHCYIIVVNFDFVKYCLVLLLFSLSCYL